MEVRTAVTVVPAMVAMGVVMEVVMAVTAAEMVMVGVMVAMTVVTAVSMEAGLMLVTGDMTGTAVEGVAVVVVTAVAKHQYRQLSHPNRWVIQSGIIHFSL